MNQIERRYLPPLEPTNHYNNMYLYNLHVKQLSREIGLMKQIERKYPLPLEPINHYVFH